MKIKNLQKLVPLKISMVGILFPLVIFGYFVFLNQTQNDLVSLVAPVSAAAKTEKTGTGLPINLSIPKIKVNASFEYVGLTPQGAVGIPKNFSKVAWFNLSSLPGTSGSAVIVGHYGIKNGKHSVFDNLYKLRKGDKLVVKNDKGEATTFVVRAIKSYTPKALVPEIFNLNDGKIHLNLITCEGVWSQAAKSYSKRLVIFTDKE
jgi:LPXTG-site transpeptidase (sortase) family protein